MTTKTLTRTREKELYISGRQARADKKKTESCWLTNTVERSWWLAGWHDLDMEKAA